MLISSYVCNIEPYILVASEVRIYGSARTWTVWLASHPLHIKQRSLESKCRWIIFRPKSGKARFILHASTERPQYDNYLFNPPPNLSISLPSTVPTPAAVRNRSTASTSLIFTASSAALIRIPHFSYIVIVSPGWRVGAALGMKTAASLGLPAERMRLKNGWGIVS